MSVKMIVRLCHVDNVKNSLEELILCSVLISYNTYCLTIKRFVRI
jgi:hypothetical protein